MPMKHLKHLKHKLPTCVFHISSIQRSSEWGNGQTAVEDGGDGRWEVTSAKPVDDQVPELPRMEDDGHAAI